MLILSQPIIFHIYKKKNSHLPVEINPVLADPVQQASTQKHYHFN